MNVMRQRNLKEKDYIPFTCMYIYTQKIGTHTYTDKQIQSRTRYIQYDYMKPKTKIQNREGNSR